MLLFYIRHGDPIYDPDMLTPLGTRQAEAVAKRLALYGIDRIYSSTSNRALQTAKPTAEMTNLTITELDFCNEKYMGLDFRVKGRDGVSRWAFADEQIKKQLVSKEVYRLGEQWYTHPAFADHTFQRGIERVHRETDGFLRTLGYEHDREQGIYHSAPGNDERVALFAHQAFGLAFLSSVLDIPYPQLATHFDMGHTGMTVVEFRERDGYVVPKILTLANDSHLYREGLPTCYQNRIKF